MKICSGLGRIWSITKPVGIRGKMRLDKGAFRTRLYVPLCDYPVLKRRVRSTQSAGETPRACCAPPWNENGLALAATVARSYIEAGGCMEAGFG